MVSRMEKNLDILNKYPVLQNSVFAFKYPHIVKISEELEMISRECKFRRGRYNKFVELGIDDVGQYLELLFLDLVYFDKHGLNWFKLKDKKRIESSLEIDLNNLNDDEFEDLKERKNRAKKIYKGMFNKIKNCEKKKYKESIDEKLEED